MSFERHLIANYSTGLQKDVRQWRLMDDAFHLLNNMYVWRGRLRKRFGSYLMGPTDNNPLTSRLRINIGTTPGPINIPGTATNTLLQIGQMFSVGNDIFTIYQLGAGVLTLSTNPGATATINSVAHPNTVTFVGEPGGTAVFWYPSFPVMGLTQFEVGLINDHPSYAFDPYFAYVFMQATGWVRSGTGTTPLWNGQLDTTFMNFFWATNWKGATVNVTTMFVTNFQVTNKNGAGAATDDPIWYLTQLDDGTGALTWTAALGANGFYFLPAPGTPAVPGPRLSSAYVVTARIIIPFRNRLVLLNTVESTNVGDVWGAGVNSWYPQRARYSFNGSPLARNAWYEPGQSDNDGMGAASIAAGAGFIDAPTDEQIITAEFIKDRLIVYFERSTWELAYTGNEQLPFIWNRLNTELGSQSTFSTVPFDKEVLTIGNTGIHACNGSNVQRIDQIIPDEVFDFDVKSNNSVRIAGIRDYKPEMVYWSIPFDNATSNQIFPNKVLVYNYKQPSWSYNDDTFTAFGYFEQSSDVTWQSLNITWAEDNDTWESNVEEAQGIQIIAGNQEGFVMILDAQETSRNAPSLQITNLTNNGATINLVVINHNLFNGDWVAVENSGMTNFDVSYTQNPHGWYPGIYQIISIIDRNNITIRLNDFQVVTGTYLGGGTLTRVSNTEMQSKQWNPYDKEDKNVYLHKIDFAVQRTISGQITIDYWPSSTKVSMLQSDTGAIMGTGVLETSPYSPVFYPLEQVQTRLWHPIYFQTDGECIQLNIYLSDIQISNPNIAWEDLEIEAMILFTERTTDRLS